MPTADDRVPGVGELNAAAEILLSALRGFGEVVGCAASAAREACAAADRVPAGAPPEVAAEVDRVRRLAVAAGVMFDGVQKITVAHQPIIAAAARG